MSNHDAKTETAEPLAAVNETAAAAADKEELLEWCREALLHRYRFLHWLGSGAFGEVVRVFDAKHSLRMAVKLIKYDHEKFDAASLYHRVIIARETLIGRAFSMSMWPTKKRSEEEEEEEEEEGEEGREAGWGSSGEVNGPAKRVEIPRQLPCSPL